VIAAYPGADGKAAFVAPAVYDRFLSRLTLESIDKMLNLNVNAVMKNVHAVAPHMIARKTGDIIVNLDAKTVEVAGNRVHLTGKEYEMLELLSLRKGTTLTKEMFLNHLYGGMDEPELKIIDVFICKLRKKLAVANDGNSYIETVWGRGYVLRDPQEQGGIVAA
jgi:two-component system cell cycle response regulator CtrA